MEKKPKTDFEMPFGQHKGKMMSECPVEYLDWLLGQTEELAKNLETHLDTRPDWDDLSNG